MKTALLLLGVLAVASGCSNKLLPNVDSDAPPSLIVISVDTLRADRLGAYDYPAARTPIADRLAKEGVTFDYAIAPVPRTTPALGSMFTGLWPHEHGAREVHDRIRHGELVAEVLQKHGFHTSAVTANPAAGRRQGFARGFDEFDQLRVTDDASVVTDHAIALLEEAQEDEPLFLWVHYFDPHSPYRAPKAWRTGPQAKCKALRKFKKGQWRSNFRGVSEKALPDCSRAYDAEIAFTDSEVGRLMKALRSADRLDNAIVVFTSDHGENFGEWGSYFGHGVNVHDAAIRVPLIVAGAGIAKSERVATPIGLHDLAPTLLALAGVPRSNWPKMSGTDHSKAARRPPGSAVQAPIAFARSGGVLLIDDHTAIISGRPRTGYCMNDERFSLCWKGESPPTLHDRSRDPLLKADVKAAHPAIYESLVEARKRWTPTDVRERSASDGHLKLVESPRLQGGFARSLYDLDQDPDEILDVKDAHRADLARLGDALDRWTAAIPGHTRRALSEEEEAQLKALGYVE